MFRESLERYVRMIFLSVVLTYVDVMWNTSECACRADGNHQRHYRDTHRLIVCQSDHAYRGDLWYWM